jgi:hypothetical protein
VYTVFASYSPHTFFSTFSLHSTGTNSPDRTCSALPFDFVKNKQTNKKTFLKFKITIQGVSYIYVL